jgi:putative oxidoreductase
LNELKITKMSTSMFLSKYESQGYAILRVIAGFLFLWHGSQKLFDFPHTGYEIPLYIMLIPGPIEFFGGLLVMAGLWTRWTALICSGEMAYAYWSSHGIHAILPLLNHGELAVLYCFLFLFISARGAGVFSVDNFLKKRRLSHQVNSIS